MTRAVRLIRKHGFLPGNGLEALVEEALSSNAPDQSERVSRLEEALREIVNPLPYMQRRAEAEGNRLSGMAYSIANDPGHLKNIASSALNDGADKLEERLQP